MLAILAFRERRRDGSRNHCAAGRAVAAGVAEHFRRCAERRRNGSSSGRNSWVALRSLARYLAERRIHDEGGQSVLRLVRMPKVKDEWRRALTDDEMFRLVEVSSEGELGRRDNVIVLTFLGCGLRRGELVSLCVGDVSVQERRIHVRASSSKSIHPRDVTVPIETLKVLDLYLADYREGEKHPRPRCSRIAAGKGLRATASANYSSDWPSEAKSGISARTCCVTRGRRTSIGPVPVPALI